MDNSETMPRWLLAHRGFSTGMLLAFPALLPFSGLYNIPLLVLCGLGLWCLMSRPHEVLRDEGLRLLLVLFLCIWLPMAIAAVDAVDPVQSWRKVVSFPVFFFAGVYMVRALRCRTDLRRLLVGVCGICILWSIDALWQFIHGFDLLGFPLRGGRASGVFFPDLKLGVVLSMMALLVLEGMRKLSERSAWAVLALIPFFAAIVLSGSRSSWVVLFVVLGVYGWYLFRWVEKPKARGRAVLRVAAAGVLVCGVLAYTAPQAVSQMHELVAKRAGSVVHLLNGDTDEVDVAIKARLSAWEAAGRIFLDHWFNGVGPRGFRKVHADYASASDPYVSIGRHLHFPHLQILEIAAETGIVGLLGYLIALTVLMRKLLGMDRVQLARGFPYWLAIVVTMFPFATYLAFYSHFMAALTWWTIAISIAGLGVVMRFGGGGDESLQQCAGYR